MLHRTLTRDTSSVAYHHPVTPHHHKNRYTQSVAPHTQSLTRRISPVKSHPLHTTRYMSHAFKYRAVKPIHSFRLPCYTLPDTPGATNRCFSVSPHVISSVSPHLLDLIQFNPLHLRRCPPLLCHPPGFETDIGSGNSLPPTMRAPVYSQNSAVNRSLDSLMPSFSTKQSLR